MLDVGGYWLPVKDTNPSAVGLYDGDGGVISACQPSSVDTASSRGRCPISIETEPDQTAYSRGVRAASAPMTAINIRPTRNKSNNGPTCTTGPTEQSFSSIPDLFELSELMNCEPHSKLATGPIQTSSESEHVARQWPTASVSKRATHAGGKQTRRECCRYDEGGGHDNPRRTDTSVPSSGLRCASSMATTASPVESLPSLPSIISSRSSAEGLTRSTTPSHFAAPAMPRRGDEPSTTVFGGRWFSVRDGDPRALALYLVHYSAEKARGSTPNRRVIGNYARFCGPGEHIVLLTVNADALFVWRKQQWRKDGQTGMECLIFRNESSVLSSTLVAEADQLAWAKWPHVARHWTYVDPGKVRPKRDPGRCFLRAGWRRCGVSKAGLVILEKLPEAGGGGVDVHLLP